MEVMEVTIRGNTYLFVAALAGCFGITSIVVHAQDTSSQKMDQGSSKMMKSADTAFAMKAAQGGMAEVQMGKLAAEKATNPDVKAFGQQMVDDHTKANDDLKSVAEKKGLTLPSDIDAHDHATYSKLEKLSGAEFDRAYVKDMVKDHEKDVKEFQKEANNGKDDDIKGFASQTLPVLQGHLDKIKSIQTSAHASATSAK
jgi:putative membrane protein